MPRLPVWLVALLAGSLLVACGADDAADEGGPATESPAPSRTTTTKKAPAPTKSKRRPAVARTSAGCRLVATPRPRGTTDRRPPSRKLDATKVYTAVLRTNCGTIKILLDVRRAPKTSSSFASLVRSGFYDGLTFHRISKPAGRDFVIQGGDPAGNGSGGPGYSVVEAPPARMRYTRGIVAMAKTEIDARGTSGSQFFIVTARDSRLPPDYAVVGRLVGSRRAVARIAATPSDPTTEMPGDPVVIEKVKIETG